MKGCCASHRPIRGWRWSGNAGMSRGGKMQLKLYLLGTPRLEYEGEPLDLALRKGMALLAYLSVTRQAHSRDHLATLLWPDKSQTVARANLRRTLYELSHLLPVPLWEGSGEQVRLA